MPIEALPQSTARAIGSTSVISDAYSVVKELVDNALDASASSLQIEISQNTVDVIQLKDNGHGIPPADQKLVCKRSFTSKIQTLDDLRNVGGSSLGFRGEALASVAEMSGAVSVTTRVESEVVGVCVKYGRDGEVTGTQRTSHPVGTTVRITDFLKHIPVRRQTMLKSAARSLTRIRKLLQSYAISQPSKRLSLKVLKATNENNNWSYAPSTNPSLLDATLKVAGKDIVSSCVLKQLCSETAAEMTEATSPERRTLEVVAFLPNTQPGQYISVDGRPLSNSRGIGQEIAKIYKSYIRSVTSKSETQKSVTDPFLALHILCPRGTYDVNIEPAKDDVMFEDRDSVLTLITNLFREHYGESDGGEKTKHQKKKDDVHKSNQTSSGFDLFMARRSVAEPQAEVIGSNEPISDTAPNESLQRRSRLEPVILSINSSEHERGHAPEGSNGNKAKRPGTINPESIARINASFRTPRIENPNQISPRPGNSLNETPTRPMRRHSEMFPAQRSPIISTLPSPPTTRRTLGSPISQRREQRHGLGSSSPEKNRMPSFRRADRERDRERYGNGALDTWFQRTTQISLEQTPVTRLEPSQEAIEEPLSSLAQQRFGISHNPSHDGADNQEQTHSLSPSSEEPSPRQSPPNQPSPLDDQFDGNPVSMDSGRGFPVLDRWAAQLHKDGVRPEPIDLEKALDFEKRKKEAIRARRLQFRTSEISPDPEPAPIPPSSQNSRYLAAKAALTSTDVSIAEPVVVSKLAPHDPRAYLMRQQESSAVNESLANGTKVKRSLINRLPFERIPDGLDMHNLSVSCSVNLAPTFCSFKPCPREDNYAHPGPEPTAFLSPDVKEYLPLWNERLERIMKEQYESKDASQPPRPAIDLSSIIDKHINSFAET
ncbi:hypothetical protein N7541_004419 [Penicillium brevicompactum]|uniref:DNA mismatch repair protein S5 domain-containing protein n=1 Tax=Penicillium brevicompactum TaxID=5074 RepID=A0A9W9RBR7_PENBR|nr:hypothetical protein N7541_004419 [Penicillium brevicompactum]